MKSILLLVSLFVLSGCANIKEGVKGFAGTSTKILEEKRSEAAVKLFNYDYNTCYSKVEGVLIDMKAYIYAKDTSKKLIAIYLSEEDTTPVGIFFKEIDKTKTQVEVSSCSSYAKFFISKKIFSALVPLASQASTANLSAKGQSDEEKQVSDKQAN